MEEFLNKEENNGFIQSKYDNIEQIEWTWVLICASDKLGNDSQAIQEYCNLMNIDTYETPVYKCKSRDIINFIKEKTGKQYTKHELKNILPEELVWDENGEVCFLATGDAGYDQAMNITGYKQADKYIVSGDYYNPQYNVQTGDMDITSFTVTLQKTNSGYIFISNVMK